MRHFCTSALSAFLFFGTFSTKAQGPEIIAGDVLVMLRPGATAEAIARDLAGDHGPGIDLHVVREVSAPMRTWLLHFDPSLADQTRMLQAVRNHPGVELAQNNHRLKMREVPNDTEYGSQWHHENIGSEAAWNISTGGVTATGDTIVVCIIENADLPHPDLFANAWFNHAEVPNNDLDDDGNGYVDDYRGWNPNSGTDEVYGGNHGTEVAGMIGAVGNNGEGAVGANWGVKMMVVFNSGASDDGVFASHTYPLVMRRRYNASNGAEGAFVVATNASWGINGGQPADAPIWCAMYDTLGTAGILNCGATTNQNDNVDEVGDLPTACPSDYMISVTATNEDDDRTFSGYGLTTVDVGAPGDDVFTTQQGGDYGTTSGTSFASPLTAGVIGLLYSAPCASMMGLVHADPEEGARFIRQKLFEGVDHVGNLEGQTVTGGRISAGNSMELIMNGCGTCPAPYGLNVQAVDLTSSLIGWNVVSGTLYDLRYRLVGAPDWTEVPGLNEAGYLITGMQGCTPYEFEVRVQCEGEWSEFSNTFTWTSEGCCSAPAGLAQGFVGTNIVNVFWNDVMAAETYDVRYAPVGSGPFITVEGVTNESLEITPLEICSDYTVQVRSLCASETSEWCSPVEVGTSGCGACVDLAYCPTEGGNTNSEWIAQVQLGTIDNVSGNDGGYGDYTGPATDLMVGAEHTITMTPGYSGFGFNEWFLVWIDVDQDGNIDGPNDLLYNSTSGSNDPVVAQLSIPADATLGSTRMRITMHSAAPLLSACAEDYQYGETEDYCVNLVANPGGGLTEYGTPLAVVVYPQPVDQQLNFRLPEAYRNSTMRLDVFDGTGRTVARSTLSGTLATFSTAELANGAYTYLMTASDGAMARGRFLVTHLR
ncbi:MAG TPA: S8 family serine peptidase [Flavobacteriales bacterium]|nr:S8 family serine peptidase [Flavobacteriales bacterium]